eukprot:TRINITY_DN21230_c0_g1_i1.p2 TRINITY_DN21230_c0_g1~~TRINITY_DN21230_c0_g1_i1.p2  ORF type:complete len:122 (-),score=8.32 TRINITY_DN21230_c0_g1_i1:85-450(-)
MCDSVPLVLLPGPHQSSPMFPGVGPVNPMLARMGLLLSFRERGGFSQPSPETPAPDAPYDLSKPGKENSDQPLDLRVDKKSLIRIQQPQQLKMKTEISFRSHGVLTDRTLNSQTTLGHTSP